jgi:AraC family transcriptional regulator of adaptative response/methylated-DNA-[protein]-cysteine methyltransferase
VKQFLEQHTDRSVTLAELAAHTGVSASHLQRAFTRTVGMSPAGFQRRLRVQRFKARLRAGDTVSRATYEAGFGSSSRVYERSDAELGMTPASYRRGGAGVHISYTISDTPVGRLLVATTDRGICAVALGGTIRDLESALHEDFPNAALERDDAAHREWVDAVVALVRDPRHVRDHRHATELPLDVGGSEFQRAVWRALQRIPTGERRTYQEVAASLGRPSAARAVARACATNRLAVIIPCHRVVRSDGTLSGYRWGVERKARLLEREE